MYAIMVWRFPIWYFLMLFWVNRCVFSPSVLLRVFLTLFPCCLSIRLFCYVLLVAIFCSKIVLLLVVGMFSCHLPLLSGRIFFVVLERRFVLILLPYLFLIFLLSPLLFGLFPRILLSFFLCCFFFFCPNMFQHFSSVLSFLLVVYFLSTFLVEFSIQVLSLW